MPNTSTDNNNLNTSMVNQNIVNNMENEIDGSMKLFGIPHQFTAENDPRLGSKSNLGRCFAERIILEAPIICLKPGLPDFLPNKSDNEKKAFVRKLLDASTGELKDLIGTLSTKDEDDAVLYYSIKDAYSEMMAKTNVLCKLMAAFLGLSDTPVPWAPSTTFGRYDWRYYSFKNLYNDTIFKPKTNTGGTIGTFIKDAIGSASSELMSDSSWLRFYVDSNASFGESSSNSTTTSMLESYTEKLEGVAKELDTISGLTGTDVQGLVSGATSSVDQYIQENVKGDSAISRLFKRISSNATQIVGGGNFLIPEIWSDSQYNKSYSFTTTFSTPYGNVKSWYLNVGVPLCHTLSICLPQQLTTNTYKSPYLVKCYSKGWFNCNYGIIDSVNIEKGADNSWSVGGLPNEIKVSLSVKDLYSTLSIPVEPYADMTTFINTGMLEFLMVNCGIDISHQDLTDKYKIWSTIIGNNFDDRFTSKPYDIQQYFKRKFQGLFNII